MERDAVARNTGEYSRGAHPGEPNNSGILNSIRPEPRYDSNTSTRSPRGNNKIPGEERYSPRVDKSPRGMPSRSWEECLPLIKDLHDRLCKEVREVIRDELKSYQKHVSEATPCLPLQVTRDEVKSNQKYVSFAHSEGTPLEQVGTDGVAVEAKVTDGVERVMTKRASTINKANTADLQKEWTKMILEPTVARASTPACLSGVMRHFVMEEVHGGVPLWLQKRLSWARMQLELAERNNARRLAELAEQRDSYTLARFVNGELFNFLVALGILLNCAFMAYAVDHEVRTYSKPNEVVHLLELVFLCWYSIELALKVAVYRLYYFIGPCWRMNVLDVLLLSQSLWTVLGNFGVARKTANVSFARVLRFLRITKVLRVVQVMSAFRQLRSLVKSLANSTATLFYSLVMFAAILFMFSLLFVQRVASYLAQMYEDGHDMEADEILMLQRAFGSVLKSMISLFMSSTGGNDWAVYYDSFQQTGTLNQVVYILFISFTQIAVLNVITGIFVDAAMKYAMDRDEKALLFMEQERHVEHELKMLMNDADQDQGGRISQSELEAAVCVGKLTNYLDMVGFKSDDLLAFHKQVAAENEDGKVDVDSFVRGCMRMKGGASSFQMQALMMEQKIVRMELSRILKELREARHVAHK